MRAAADMYCFQYYGVGGVRQGKRPRVRTGSGWECEGKGEGALGTPIKLMSSPSDRELAHQQFVSVWERGPNDTSVLGHNGGNQANTNTHVSIVTALFGTVRIRLTERPL